MKFVITTVGSAGDVFPMVGLALELKRRGHDVHLMTNEYFKPLAQRHEIPFEALGSKELYMKAIQNPDLWIPHKAFNHVFNTFKGHLRDQHRFIVNEAAKGPMTVISSCLGFGARVARETHNIPLVTVHLQPAVIWSDVAPPTIGGLGGPRWFKNLMFRVAERFAVDSVVWPFLNPWRAEFGLAPRRHLFDWWNSPDGILCMFPEWFAPSQADWPRPLMQSDFPLWNDSTDVQLDDTTQAFLDKDDPPLVFTPGTANIHGKSFFETAVATCKTLKRRGILLTRHPEQLPQQLPDSICHINYAPLDDVLARSAAFIHHGGIGSTSQGFLAGIPQLVMPLAHDQFDNAHRVEVMNAGKGIPVKRFTPRNVTTALNSLLNSKEVADSCHQAQQKVAPRDGLIRSANEIEARFV
ncbi:glycosyltransferase [Planctomicrobium sp. SH668]|uniref:glycosyltransferase n=1 Tax=Planctomicrobium sp. SH668 TaxID=3448126 RepID=UPI003F5BB2A2